MPALPATSADSPTASDARAAENRGAHDAPDARDTEASAANLSTQTLWAELCQHRRAQAARETTIRAIVAAQEAERRRISRELHDGVGQHVTTLLLGLKRLEKELHGHPTASAVIESLHHLAEQIGHEIHDVAWELRPLALDEFGLVRALASSLEHWSARASLHVQFDHAALGEEQIPPHLETTLFRVICEAVHNTVKHARASHVSVLLHRDCGGVTAIVEDDGVGFDASTATRLEHPEHLGLAGMRERVTLVNGEFIIESESGRGTTIIARVPLPAAQSAA